MDLKPCVQERRSIRKYKDTPVDQGLIEQIVQTASYAPSWKNLQTTRYIVISNPELKRKLAEDCVMGFELNIKSIQSAPVLILITTISPRSGFNRDGTPVTSKGTHWESFDAGIATQTLCLAAQAEGLGTLIMGIYDEEKVREVAGVPEGQKVSAMLAIGYPSESPEAPKRKTADELITFLN